MVLDARALHDHAALEADSLADSHSRAAAREERRAQVSREFVASRHSTQTRTPWRRGSGGKCERDKSTHMTTLGPITAEGSTVAVGSIRTLPENTNGFLDASVRSADFCDVR